MRLILPLLLAFSVIAGAPDARAQNADDPVRTIAKSTFWGGVTGLALGGAVALVSDGDETDIITWGLVIGVFSGFGFGVYHVLSNQHRSYGLLEYNSGMLSLRIPEFALASEGPPDDKRLYGRVTLFAAGF